MKTGANPGRGLFIVFEGLDGSGKGTQVKRLAERIRSGGGRVYCTAEPTSSATGGLIRDTLGGGYKRGPEELAALFLCDRIAHNKNPRYGIQTFLNQGIHVLCDRYYYSSFAYQGTQADIGWVMDINLECKQILKPDICIFLDAAPEECKRRIDSERAHLEIFEGDVETLRNIRDNFFEVFKMLEGRENIKTVDAGRDEETVAAEIYGLISDKL